MKARKIASHLVSVASALAVLAAAVAFATPAEQTGTLTDPVITNLNGFRVTHYERNPLGGGVFKITVQLCSAGCATTSPTMVAGTETYFEVGVPNSSGAGLRTNVSGYGVTVGNRNAACSVRPQDLRQFFLDAALAGAGDIPERAAKQVAISCLGGT